MSEPVTDRQKNCGNGWHRAPGALLACAVCGMTQTQLKDNPPAVRAAPPPNNAQQQAGRGHRVQIKSFTHPDANMAIEEANAWLTKVASDPRIQLAEQLSMFSHNGLFVIAVYYALEF